MPLFGFTYLNSYYYPDLLGDCSVHFQIKVLGTSFLISSGYGKKKRMKSKTVLENPAYTSNAGQNTHTGNHTNLNKRLLQIPVDFLNLNF